MPPEGYETVTLPEELLEDIDDHATAIGAESRAEAIRSLYQGSDVRVAAHVEVVDDPVIEDIANRVSVKTADELEGRLR